MSVSNFVCATYETLRKSGKNFAVKVEYAVSAKFWHDAIYTSIHLSSNALQSTSTPRILRAGYWHSDSFIVLRN